MWNGVHHVKVLVLRCSGRVTNRVIVIRERVGPYSQIEYEQARRRFGRGGADTRVS